MQRRGDNRRLPVTGSGQRCAGLPGNRIGGIADDQIPEQEILIEPELFGRFPQGRIAERQRNRGKNRIAGMEEGLAERQVSVNGTVEIPDGKGIRNLQGTGAGPGPAYCIRIRLQQGRLYRSEIPDQPIRSRLFGPFYKFLHRLDRLRRDLFISV